MNQFHLEVQYVPESITLLNMIAQPAGFETEYMNSIAARYGITPDEEAKKYVDYLEKADKSLIFTYPQTERLKLDDGQNFFDS